LADKALVEFAPRMEGNTMHAILVPAKKAEPVKPVKAKSQSPPTQQSPPTAQQA
jgi:translation initiation factor IF-3